MNLYRYYSIIKTKDTFAGLSVLIIGLFGIACAMLFLYFTAVPPQQNKEIPLAQYNELIELAKEDGSLYLEIQKALADDGEISTKEYENISAKAFENSLARERSEIIEKNGVIHDITQKN